MAHGLLDAPLVVVNRCGIELLSALLHDETCAVDEISYEPSTKRLLLPTRRQFHEGSEVVVGVQGDATTYEKSWMRTEVAMEHVINWKKHDDQGIGDYSFNEWSVNGHVLQIVFCEALVIVVEVDQLWITVTDLGFRGRARIVRYPGGAESSSSRVY